ncbi:ABC transporter substrate-binding protein [Aliiroseovarius sp. F20344]|uniref:ABC transporter substrate-binding protein n=1 Tax=Aliiroseovarius sp. F20344 TaxID=2926414 RepID=UPI001FF5E512|nr:ABC transporter substrate-binding protein [Aliiroseovarius sp. F20344]MCK0141130.1 ABC transporter substrate-binding protein [Aliiroseovarius sp. F20344]
MRYILALILCFLPSFSIAQEWEDKQLFQGENARKTLRVLSSTDTAFFAPIVEQFLARNPDWSIEYLVTSTAQIDQLLREDPDRFDIVISSAMDLQLKLVNDGFARALPGIAHPSWAQWRGRLFAFTTEPATIVINKAAFNGKPIPQTRQELILALRQEPDLFRGRIGTYDVRQSGLGYLFATQDARASETFWRLTEIMGSLDARLYCCSGEMIDDVASGKLLVAYNVLGSYAATRQLNDDRFEIILPSDFPTMMMRTGFVSKHTQHPDAAEAFIQNMIDIQTSGAGAGSSRLPPLYQTSETASPSVIVLEPALMTYLDKLKRRTFVKEWMNAVIQ